MTSDSKWKLVPVEPTDEMYLAALTVTRDPGYGHVHDATGGAVYRAMLAAAPAPAGDPLAFTYRNWRGEVACAGCSRSASASDRPNGIQSRNGCCAPTTSTRARNASSP